MQYCKQYNLEENSIKRVLTDKEYRIIKYVAEGFKNKDIAVKLNTSENMIKNHLRVVYNKLGVWNRTELALWYVSREIQ